MEIKIQKLKSNTSSNIKKYNKFHHEQKTYINKNNNISNTNINISINKNIANSKYLKLAHSNNIISNEKEKNQKIKIQLNEAKNNNKLILGIDAEKSKEKVRQNSYNGLMKTEEANLDKKVISINKQSFLAKTYNFSSFNIKNKKDISINNENINNNIPKNKNEPINFENSNKKNQINTLIKVTEKNKKFKRTFSGYGIRRKSSMNKKSTSNNKYYNFTVNKKTKTNNSQNKQKEQITVCNNNIQINKNLNNENSNIAKNIISKSAKKYKINENINNKDIKDAKTNEKKLSPTHILNYKEKNPVTNIAFQNQIEANNINNNKILNKSGNNFYDKKIKEKFFDGNISYSGNTNNIIDKSKNIKKTNSIISINLKYIEPHHVNIINTNKIVHKKNNSISNNNNIVNIKVKMTNRIVPVNSIRDKHILVEQISQEPVITTKNLLKKDINFIDNKQNILGGNNETILKQKNGNKNNSVKFSNYKIKNSKNVTESKSQNKCAKINLEKHFNNNDNTYNINTNYVKKISQNANMKNKHHSDKMITTKIKEQEKSKGKEKELTKNKKQQNTFCNDFSTITHRSNNTKGNSLSNIKQNKTINTNIIKYSNIDSIKKKFIEVPLTINEIEEKSDDMLSKGYSFVINILSNWGNQRKVGITEIEIFDRNNKKIKINDIKIKGGEGNYGRENLYKLYNNKIHTINENDMWVIDINKRNNLYSQFLNINLYIYANIDNNKSLLENIGYIIIWNYNGWEVNRGVKKIDIFKDEYIYYSGIIPRGEHTILQEHLYKIKLKKKFFIKRNENLKGSALNINNNKNNNSIKLEKYKHQRERSFDCNLISCNMSVTNKNYYKCNQIKRKKENDENVQKRSHLSFLKSSSNQKNRIKFPTILSTFKSQFSSSRSCKKDRKINSSVNLGYVGKFNILLNNRRNNNKNLVSSHSANNIKKNFNKKMNINTDVNGAVKNIVIKNKIIYSMKNQSYDNKKRYSNNTFGSSNKFLTNIKSITFNSNIPKNIYNSLRNEDPIKKNSFFLSNTFRVDPGQNNIPYITFKKIRINILSNYGNQLSVGLTGINLIDNNQQIIDIESACAIGALPKDLRTVYGNENDFRIFENLFNGENNTTDENNMWLTLISHEPYIEICFEDYINLSKIEFWNFNEPMSLDNGVKEIEIIFDDECLDISGENNNIKKYNVILWKGLGIDYCNYFQTIKCDEKYLKKLSNKYEKLKNNIDSIKLPIGFIFKIVFISNYGDEKTISLKKLELFNENNEILNKYNVIDDINYKINLINESSNDLFKEDYFYYHDFYDFRKNKDSICNNNLYICFEEIVQIKCIKLYNTDDEKLKTTSAKNIQIYCDDILICEKTLNQKGENVVEFENGIYRDNLDDLTENETRNMANNNYNAYKEIMSDGIFRLVL